MADGSTLSGVRPPFIIQGRWKIDRRLDVSHILTSTYKDSYYPVMLKRLIEVALPLKEVSEQSAREKSIRHGHISTLHIWWARRPLAACRAAVFASLIPDPDDPECPEDFRTLVTETLKRSEFIPKNGDGSATEDTPRNRCLEYIKYLVRWENSNKPEYIEPARKLIAAAHKFLHPGADGDAPKVLDPFAGGGAIPLEALRLGCEAHAIDLNPVAHLIELCTLVYPQRYGQPDSRAVPSYIERLVALNRAKKSKGEERPLLKDEQPHGPVTGAEAEEIVPDVEITAAEYRKNPLAADVRYWGHWILEQAHREIGQFYSPDSDGSIPVAYLWARTVKSPDPTTNASIPLIRQLWLCKKSKRKVALRMTPNVKTGRCEFTIAEGKEIDFGPDEGTMKRGQVACPFSGTVMSGEDLRRESKAGRMDQQLIAVVTVKPGRSGRRYRAATEADLADFVSAVRMGKAMYEQSGSSDIPSETVTPDRPSPNSRGLSAVVRYGMDKFGNMFNARQLLLLVTFSRLVRKAVDLMGEGDAAYATGVGTYLAFAVDRLAENSSILCRWNATSEKLQGTFGRQALAMVWDYCETSPFGGSVGSWDSLIANQVNGFSYCNFRTEASSQAIHGSADRLPAEAGSVDLVLTDPPYYDSVPYSDLSDFFYVWLKRTVGHMYGSVLRTPLTPKSQELIAYYGSGKRSIQKTPEWYEEGMRRAFSEFNRVLRTGAVACVMFAHKTTAAWEALISGLLGAGIVVDASWPLHTEKGTRLVARNAAALASSVTLVCRRRGDQTGSGLWDDVRNELKQVAKERLDFFWSHGIRGADFFISAIGPALSVFGKYERVTKLSGEEVTVGQFLDEVRGLVTNYALTKIMKTSHTSNIDAESQFYVIWRWSYADAKVPADESFKLAQALGMATETMWDRTGVLEKSGENVLAMPIAKRMKVKDLGEPNADGTPGSLIDVLHRLCVFREKNDTDGMEQFVARSGQGNNPARWIVAQAISDILPDGDKEKQLMQGLLNQKEKLEQAAEQRRLF